MKKKTLLLMLLLSCSSSRIPWKEGEDRTAKVFDNERKKEVLRVFYPKNKFGNVDSGAQWIYYLDKNYEDYQITYWLRLSPDFDCKRGGKLPGLIGGHQKGKVHSTLTGGHKPDGSDGWSARVMWRKNCRLVQYVYHKNQPGNFGEDFPWKIVDKFVYLTPGKWHEISIRVAMNHPGMKDGVIQAWFDGVNVLNQRNFEFRNKLDLGIDAFYFSTFFGGDDKTWSPERDGYIYFDLDGIK